MHLVLEVLAQLGRLGVPHLDEAVDAPCAATHVSSKQRPMLPATRLLDTQRLQRSATRLQEGRDASCAACAPTPARASIGSGKRHHS